jgi:hypothetical protein
MSDFFIKKNNLEGVWKVWETAFFAVVHTFHTRRFQGTGSRGRSPQPCQIAVMYVSIVRKP